MIICKLEFETFIGFSIRFLEHYTYCMIDIMAVKTSWSVCFISVDVAIFVIVSVRRVTGDIGNWAVKV